MQLENESGVILCFITEHTTTRHVLTVFEHGVCHAMFYLLRDRSVFTVGTGPEICQMVEQKKSLSHMENVSKILLSRMDHKLKKSLSHI